MTEAVETKSNRHKHILAGIGVIVIAIGLISGYYYYSKIYPHTDNAYVNANLINISPKVGGYIRQIYVKDNQYVKKGDLLIELDPKDYTIMLTKAQQDQLLAQQQANNSKEQIANAKANVAIAKSDFNFAKDMANRYTTLYQQKAGSLQDMQKYVNQANQARENLAQANSSLNQALMQYQAAITQAGIAKTNLETANINNGYTQLRAPVDGYTSNLNLQVGELVSPGQKLFGLVDNANWWVDVNLKETQLRRIKVGQTASVELDMYDHKYHGTVQSISYASGNTFSLLPAENATGNWVKVTQRFTVRVKLDNDPNFPLRVGASSNVTIDTK